MCIPCAYTLVYHVTLDNRGPPLQISNLHYKKEHSRSESVHINILM